jgi:hypothetical protein
MPMKTASCCQPTRSCRLEPNDVLTLLDHLKLSARGAAQTNTQALPSLGLCLKYSSQGTQGKLKAACISKWAQRSEVSTPDRPSSDKGQPSPAYSLSQVSRNTPLSQPTRTLPQCLPLLLRPDEVLSGILDAPVLEVTHDALRVLLQHHHMSAGCVA